MQPLQKSKNENSNGLDDVQQAILFGSFFSSDQIPETARPTAATWAKHILQLRELPAYTMYTMVVLQT